MQIKRRFEKNEKNKYSLRIYSRSAALIITVHRRTKSHNQMTIHFRPSYIESTIILLKFIVIFARSEYALTACIIDVERIPMENTIKRKSHKTSEMQLNSQQ